MFDLLQSDVDVDCVYAEHSVYDEFTYYLNGWMQRVNALLKMQHLEHLVVMALGILKCMQ